MFGAYLVPGAAAWAAVGLAVGVAAVEVPWLSTAALVASVIYGCAYGAAEVARLALACRSGAPLAGTPGSADRG